MGIQEERRERFSSRAEFSRRKEKIFSVNPEQGPTKSEGVHSPGPGCPQKPLQAQSHAPPPFPSIPPITSSTPPPGRERERGGREREGEGERERERVSDSGNEREREREKERDRKRERERERE